MGRVRQTGDKITVQVDLVDASTGAQLWGEEYERKVSDVLLVKQAIALEVTEKLRLRLSPEQQQHFPRRETTNAEAYQFYARGRYFWNKRRDGATNLKKAIEEFQHAIDKDPNYGPAYVGLADSYVLLEELVRTPSSEALPLARAAASRALQIDESMAEAHASLGMIEQRSWNFDAAEREYKRAMALNPRYPTAHEWYSLYLTDVKGRFDESMTELRLAQQFDSLSPIIENSIAGSYLCRGELDSAIDAAKKVLELDPKFYGSHVTLSIVY